MSVNPGSIVRAVDLSDSGVQTIPGTVAGDGWTLEDQQYRSFGPLMAILIQGLRTGADLVAGSTGNIGGDPILFTLPEGFRPSMRLHGGYTASVTSGGFTIDPGGVCRLVDAHSTASIATGNRVRVYATYFPA